MEISPEKVTHLSNRVDILHQLLEEIDCKVSDLLMRQETSADTVHPKFGVSPPARMVAKGLNEAFEHKDILNDEPHFGLDQFTGNQALSPEIQVQRLTAQLTAAYNRIAALEEQLLTTHRSH